MKKFTFIIAALLISLIGFGQHQSIKLHESIQSTNSQKAGWHGNTNLTALDNVETGYEYAIRVEAGALTSGDEVTKVKFYSDATNYTAYGVTNNSYVIKIYEGGSFDETTGNDVITACGTAVFTQAYTASTDGWQEVVLTTPYSIGSGEFWVSIFCNGPSAVFMGAAAPASANTYVRTYNNAGTDIWINNEFCVDEECTSTEFNPWALALYYDDGAAYEENSDLYSMFLNGATAPYSELTSITISETEDLVIYPTIGNDGPDNTNNTVDILIEAESNEIINAADVDFTTANTLEVGYFTWLAEGGAITITAADLTTMGLTGEFDVCITVHYDGIDNVAANNTACLAVTRGEVTPTTCDLEAIYMTSYTNATPIPSTLTISVTDDITIFPAVKNNGPDNANTSGTVVFTINDVEALNQSVDFAGLPSGSVAPLTAAAGQTITAADMNTMGLTGTFDVCMSVTYAGTDNVAGNNETCVTVTRNPVNVNTNIASAISIYPNPANDVISVANAENANVTIVDMIGNVVATVENASSNETINISNLANGTYFVRVNGEVFKFNVVK